MQRISEMLRAKAIELLKSGAVSRILCWKSGGLPCDMSPAFLTDETQFQGAVYNAFCGTNLSKYLVDTKNASEKTLVFLKPCDTYGLNQLAAEHKISREQVFVVGIPCTGMLDMEKIRARGIRNIQAVSLSGDTIVVQTTTGEKSLGRQDALLEKCRYCKGAEHAAFDELLGTDENVAQNESLDRFADVSMLEGKTPEERFAFWRGELSRCIRCNACRNVCPACTCIQCVFDTNRFKVKTKVSSDDFEDNLYHIIRAYHVAGRCTDCGECGRVCPQNIPLHLLNRKFIQDINRLYGDYQAGADARACSPLTEYAKDDAEPGIVSSRGGVR
jgi:ferredoxin